MMRKIALAEDCADSRGGAGGRTRTDMSLRTPDFESGAYTNFATPAARIEGRNNKSNAWRIATKAHCKLSPAARNRLQIVALELALSLFANNRNRTSRGRMITICGFRLIGLVLIAIIVVVV